MLERYISRIKKNGWKVTPKRKAIVQIFLESGKYATPEEVWQKLKMEFRKIGLPTVYRNLEYFNRIGILVRVEGAENRFYYGLCQAKSSKEHHHHIVCTKCHRVEEVDTCEFQGLISYIEANTGFKVSEHSLQLKGLCRQCQ